MKLTSNELDRVILEETLKFLKEEFGTIGGDDEDSMVPDAKKENPSSVTSDELANSLKDTATDIKSSPAKKQMGANENGELKAIVQSLLTKVMEKEDATSILKRIRTSIERALESKG